jgi:hypothetical protein
MYFFEEAALRLKQQLKVTEDKQVAESLGMTGNAWTMRKRRNTFPEKELRALAQQRPDLEIDVDYVLTGEQPVAAKPAWLRLKAQLGVDDDGEVAQWLGMDVAAVNTFTRRGVFPVQQFKAACSRNPGAVDPDYVMSGVGMAALEIMDAAKAGTPLVKLSGEELQLLQQYRSCKTEDDEVIRHQAAFLASRKTGA